MLETQLRSRSTRAIPSPYRLDAADLRAILRIVREVNAVDSLDDLRRIVPDLLLGLVPGDLAGFHEIDLPTGRAQLTWGSRPAAPKKVGRFGEFMLEHPPLRHIRHTGDGSAIAISDLLDRDTYRSTRTYREFAELSGEDQIVISLPTRQPMLIGVPITRDSWGFLPREHALLDELRPHLAQAYASLAARDWLRAVVDARDAALERAAAPDLRRFGLTAAEAAVLQGVVAGTSTAELAASLFVATSTVRKHLQSCYRKLGVHSRSAAVALVLTDPAPRSNSD